MWISGGGRRGPPSIHCYHDSGVAAGGGGGWLDRRLPGRFGVEGEGHGPKALAGGVQGWCAWPCVARGLSSSFAKFPPGGGGSWNPLCRWWLRAPFRVVHPSGGVNKAGHAAGGVWRPQPHCGRPVPAAFGFFPGGACGTGLGGRTRRRKEIKTSA